jgi:hypothetical protein
MSEKVRPDLDPVDIGRWLDNVARRLTEKFGVEVHPVLLKHADPPPAPMPEPAIPVADPAPTNPIPEFPQVPETAPVSFPEVPETAPVSFPRVPETAPVDRVPPSGRPAVGVAQLTDAIIRPYAGPLPGRPALMAELRDRVTAALNGGLGEEYAAQLAARIAATHGGTDETTEPLGEPV